jgi:hypothetical protein
MAPAFAKGRDFAAWLGLVPKQIVDRDRMILGRISKRGNHYLRTLFMQGARVILLSKLAKAQFWALASGAADRDIGQGSPLEMRKKRAAVTRGAGPPLRIANRAKTKLPNRLCPPRVLAYVDAVARYGSIRKRRGSQCRLLRFEPPSP